MRTIIRLLFVALFLIGAYLLIISVPPAPEAASSEQKPPPHTKNTKNDPTTDMIVDHYIFNTIVGDDY